MCACGDSDMGGAKGDEGTASDEAVLESLPRLTGREDVSTAGSEAFPRATHLVLHAPWSPQTERVLATGCGYSSKRPAHLAMVCATMGRRCFLMPDKSRLLGLDELSILDPTNQEKPSLASEAPTTKWPEKRTQEFSEADMTDMLATERAMHVCSRERCNESGKPCKQYYLVA